MLFRSDLPPAALAGKATLRIASAGGSRDIAVADFFVNSRRTVLSPGELLEAVLLPRPAPGCGTSFERFGLRRGLAVAVASVAARVELNSGKIVGASAALGAVAATPMLVAGLASILSGQVPSSKVFALAAVACADAARPISDARGSAEFRSEIVAVLARRAFERAAARAVTDAETALS